MHAMTTDRHASDQRRRVDQVTPGHFKLRLAKLGWMVPARIVLDWTGRYHAVLDGVTYAGNPDPWSAPHVERIHAYGRAIGAAEYDQLLSLKRWAAAHDPDHPCLHPLQAVDPMTLRPMPTQGTW
jgi:hypothetical protein